MLRPDLVVTPIRTSTVLIDCGGTTVLTDPWFGDRMSGRKVIRQPAISLADLPRIDIVLASHLHTDHFDRSAVAVLAGRNPDLVVIGVRGTRRFMLESGDSSALDASVVHMKPWREVTVGPMRVLATPAKHTGPAPAEVNYVVDLHGWRLFFGGDARFSDAFGQVAQRCDDIDLALVPVGGTLIWGKRTTMAPEDAVKACSVLGARYAIGIHEGGEWPAMPPVSRHPGRRVDFNRLLGAADTLCEPLDAGPGRFAVLADGRQAMVQPIGAVAA